MSRPDRRGLPRANRRGFTLVEVLVALVAGAVIVLGARLMLEGVADGTQRVARQAQRTDRDANAERMLRGVVAALEVSDSEGRRFGGDQNEARFTSWCDTPGGWQEACFVTLAVRVTDAAGNRSKNALVLTLPDGARVSVRTGFASGELRYLAHARGSGEWFSTWAAGIALPLAIGAILDRDTLIFRIGERG